MTHDQLVALLERERIRDFDALEAERFTPESAERGYWNRTPFTGQDDD